MTTIDKREAIAINRLRADISFEMKPGFIMFLLNSPLHHATTPAEE
tara:strand:- start:1011 stop:1148 length:138 start_codon:yes stop_codon:yes gene_type:complete